MPRGRPVKRKNSVLRTLVGDANVDKAFKHVYDKIDDLMPDIAITGSPILSREAPIGKTLLAQNNKGQNIIAIKTEKGWETDINAQLSLVEDTRTFQTSKGLNSKSKKPIEGESLKYSKFGEINIVDIPKVTSDTDKFLVSDGGTVKYVTGDTFRTYIDGLRFTGSQTNGVLTYKDADSISVESNFTFHGSTLRLNAPTDPTNDYATFSVASTGDLTIATVGDGSLDSDLILDIDGNVIIDVDAGEVTFKDDGTKNAAIIGPSLIIYDTSDSDNFMRLNTSTHGETTLSTVDDGTTNAHLNLVADGDLNYTSATTHKFYKASTLLATITENSFKLHDDADDDDNFEISIAAGGTTTLKTNADLGSPDIMYRPVGKNVFKASTGGPYIFELAAAGADEIGHGQIWVKSDAPNNLYFTDDTGQDVALTNNGNLPAKTRVWTNTSGGYKTNNNSALTYYFQNYPNYHSWANADSSPTSISYYDSYSYQWCAPVAGVLTNISVTCRAYDTGVTDPLKFYVYKGVPGNNASSTGLTLIGTTGTITPIASKQMFLSTDITSSNDFAAGDKLWVMYKKDSTSGNQDLYFAVTISGEYT